MSNAQAEYHQVVDDTTKYTHITTTGASSNLLSPPRPHELTYDLLACPKCGTPTNLPYMCRLCWQALGTMGQRAFYRAVKKGKRDE